ncbi:MAG: sialidase family protein [Gaiellales bacterium]
MPLIADPNSGALYLVWWGSPEVDNRALESKDRTEIFLRVSTNGGKTWGARRTVNNDAGKGVNHLRWDRRRPQRPGGRGLRRPALAGARR